MSQAPAYLLWIAHAQSWLQMILDLVVACLAVIVIGAAVGTRTNAKANALRLTLLNMVSLEDTLNKLTTASTSLETSMGAMARIESFTETTPSNFVWRRLSPSRERGRAMDMSRLTGSAPATTGPIQRPTGVFATSLLTSRAATS